MTNDTKQEVVCIRKKPRTDIAEVQHPVPMVGALEEVERLFDRLMPRSWIMSPMAWNWPMWGGLEESLESIRSPQMDVIDRDKDMLIRG